MSSEVLVIFIAFKVFFLCFFKVNFFLQWKFFFSLIVMMSSIPLREKSTVYYRYRRFINRNQGATTLSSNKTLISPAVNGCDSKFDTTSIGQIMTDNKNHSVALRNVKSFEKGVSNISIEHSSESKKNGVLQEINETADLPNGFENSINESCNGAGEALCSMIDFSSTDEKILNLDISESKQSLLDIASSNRSKRNSNRTLLESTMIGKDLLLDTSSHPPSSPGKAPAGCKVSSLHKGVGSKSLPSPKIKRNLVKIKPYRNSSLARSLLSKNDISESVNGSLNCEETLNGISPRAKNIPYSPSDTVCTLNDETLKIKHDLEEETDIVCAPSPFDESRYSELINSVDVTKKQKRGRKSKFKEKVKCKQFEVTGCRSLSSSPSRIDSLLSLNNNDSMSVLVDENTPFKQDSNVSNQLDDSIFVKRGVLSKMQLYTKLNHAIGDKCSSPRNDKSGCSVTTPSRATKNKKRSITGKQRQISFCANSVDANVVSSESTISPSVDQPTLIDDRFLDASTEPLELSSSVVTVGSPFVKRGVLSKMQNYYMSVNSTSALSMNDTSNSSPKRRDSSKKIASGKRNVPLATSADQSDNFTDKFEIPKTLSKSASFIDTRKISLSRSNRNSAISPSSTNISSRQTSVNGECSPQGAGQEFTFDGLSMCVINSPGDQDSLSSFSFVRKSLKSKKASCSNGNVANVSTDDLKFVTRRREWKDLKNADSTSPGLLLTSKLSDLVEGGRIEHTVADNTTDGDSFTATAVKGAKSIKRTPFLTSALKNRSTCRKRTLLRSILKSTGKMSVLESELNLTGNNRGVEKKYSKKVSFAVPENFDHSEDDSSLIDGIEPLNVTPYSFEVKSPMKTDDQLTTEADFSVVFGKSSSILSNTSTPILNQSEQKSIGSVYGTTPTLDESDKSIHNHSYSKRSPEKCADKKSFSKSTIKVDDTEVSRNELQISDKSPCAISNASAPLDQSELTDSAHAVNSSQAGTDKSFRDNRSSKNLECTNENSFLNEVKSPTKTDDQLTTETEFSVVFGKSSSVLFDTSALVLNQSEQKSIGSVCVTNSKLDESNKSICSNNSYSKKSFVKCADKKSFSKSTINADDAELSKNELPISGELSYVISNAGAPLNRFELTDSAHAVNSSQAGTDTSFRNNRSLRTLECTNENSFLNEVNSPLKTNDQLTTETDFSVVFGKSSTVLSDTSAQVLNPFEQKSIGSVCVTNSKLDESNNSVCSNSSYLKKSFIKCADKNSFSTIRDDAEVSKNELPISGELSYVISNAGAPLNQSDLIDSVHAVGSSRKGRDTSFRNNRSLRNLECTNENSFLNEVKSPLKTDVQLTTEADFSVVIGKSSSVFSNTSTPVLNQSEQKSVGSVYVTTPTLDKSGRSVRTRSYSKKSFVKCADKNSFSKSTITDDAEVSKTDLPISDNKSPSVISNASAPLSILSNSIHVTNPAQTERDESIRNNRSTKNIECVDESSLLSEVRLIDVAEVTENDLPISSIKSVSAISDAGTSLLNLSRQKVADLVHITSRSFIGSDESIRGNKYAENLLAGCADENLYSREIKSPMIKIDGGEMEKDLTISGESLSTLFDIRTPVLNQTERKLINVSTANQSTDGNDRCTSRSEENWLAECVNQNIVENDVSISKRPSKHSSECEIDESKKGENNISQTNTADIREFSVPKILITDADVSSSSDVNFDDGKSTVQSLSSGEITREAAINTTFENYVSVAHNSSIESSKLSEMVNSIVNNENRVSKIEPVIVTVAEDNSTEESSLYCTVEDVAEICQSANDQIDKVKNDGNAHFNLNLFNSTPEKSEINVVANEPDGAASLSIIECGSTSADAVMLERNRTSANIRKSESDQKWRDTMDRLSVAKSVVECTELIGIGADSIENNNATMEKSLNITQVNESYPTNKSSCSRITLSVDKSNSNNSTFLIENGKESLGNSNKICSTPSCSGVVQDENVRKDNETFSIVAIDHDNNAKESFTDKTVCPITPEKCESIRAEVNDEETAEEDAVDTTMDNKFILSPVCGNNCSIQSGTVNELKDEAETNNNDETSSESKSNELSVTFNDCEKGLNVTVNHDAIAISVEIIKNNRRSSVKKSKKSAASVRKSSKDKSIIQTHTVEAGEIIEHNEILPVKEIAELLATTDECEADKRITVDNVEKTERFTRNLDVISESADGNSAAFSLSGDMTELNATVNECESDNVAVQSTIKIYSERVLPSVANDDVAASLEKHTEVVELIDESAGYSCDDVLSSLITESHGVCGESTGEITEQNSEELDGSHFVESAERTIKQNEINSECTSDSCDSAGNSSVYRVKDVLKMFSPKSDYSNVSDLRVLFRTGSPVANYDRVSGVKFVMNYRSPVNDCTRVSGIKRLLERCSPLNDYTNIDDIANLFIEDDQAAGKGSRKRLKVKTVQLSADEENNSITRSTRARKKSKDELASLDDNRVGEENLKFNGFPDVAVDRMTNPAAGDEEEPKRRQLRNRNKIQGDNDGSENEIVKSKDAALNRRRTTRAATVKRTDEDNTEWKENSVGNEAAKSFTGDDTVPRRPLRQRNRIQTDNDDAEQRKRTIKLMENTTQHKQRQTVKVIIAPGDDVSQNNLIDVSKKLLPVNENKTLADNDKKPTNKSTDVRRRTTRAVAAKPAEQTGTDLLTSANSGSLNGTTLSPPKRRIRGRNPPENNPEEPIPKRRTTKVTASKTVDFNLEKEQIIDDNVTTADDRMAPKKRQLRNRNQTQNGGVEVKSDKSEDVAGCSGRRTVKFAMDVANILSDSCSKVPHDDKLPSRQLRNKNQTRNIDGAETVGVSDDTVILKKRRTTKVVATNVPATSNKNDSRRQTRAKPEMTSNLKNETASDNGSAKVVSLTDNKPVLRKLRSRNNDKPTDELQIRESNDNLVADKCSANKQNDPIKSKRTLKSEKNKSLASDMPPVNSGKTDLSRKIIDSNKRTARLPLPQVECKRSRLGDETIAITSAGTRSRNKNTNPVPADANDENNAGLKSTSKNLRSKSNRRKVY